MTIVKYLIFMFFLISPLYADSVGPIFPSTCSNNSTSPANGGPWVNPSSATVEDGNNATSTVAISYYLYCSGYGFTIPSSAIITGVVLGAKEINVTNVNTDNSIKLFESGSPVGNDKATGLTWPASLTWVTYGASTDTWGVALTPAIVNDTLFGAGVSAIKSNGGVTSYGVDAEEMTIYYTRAPVTTILYNASINNGQFH